MHGVSLPAFSQDQLPELLSAHEDWIREVVRLMEWALFWTIVAQFAIAMGVLVIAVFILGAAIIAIKQVNEEKK
jgi:hypothetical protein